MQGGTRTGDMEKTSMHIHKLPLILSVVMTLGACGAILGCFSATLDPVSKNSP